ncbi:MAG TPA: flagellar biosynthetic protein FliQ [Kofleriaceae bacterium]|jgi:flagellar biosynthetic protein FliQ
MTEDALLDLWRTSITIAAEVAAPFVLVGLAAGLVIAILQTATQLQESALTFVPKLGIALVVLSLGGHWMLDKLGNFTVSAFRSSAEPHALDEPSITPAPTTIAPTP